MDCEVSARLLVDGTPVRLRRQWHEIWKKPAGGGEAAYDRDETLCWVDDVPVKLEKEYPAQPITAVRSDIYGISD